MAEQKESTVSEEPDADGANRTRDLLITKSNVRIAHF